LRREVELLLSQQTCGGFLDRPAIQNAPELLVDSIYKRVQAMNRLTLRLEPVEIASPDGSN
jgi:hypothetical protein